MPTSVTRARVHTSTHCTIKGKGVYATLHIRHKRVKALTPPYIRMEMTTEMPIKSIRMIG